MSSENEKKVNIDMDMSDTSTEKTSIPRVDEPKVRYTPEISEEEREKAKKRWAFMLYYYEQTDRRKKKNLS